MAVQSDGASDWPTLIGQLIVILSASLPAPVRACAQYFSIATPDVMAGGRGGINEDYATL